MFAAIAAGAIGAGTLKASTAGAWIVTIGEPMGASALYLAALLFVWLLIFGYTATRLFTAIL